MLRLTKGLMRKFQRLIFAGQRTWRYRSSSAAKEKALRYEPGQRIHGFTVQQVSPVPDLFLTAIQLTHDNTGAQYLHVARDDPNNLFSVQFRTTPMDSTGVPHILEHTVLCGSLKFPCRDPFFKMLNRSLSTFMNAFTASDYTMYPFSTQNAKDFQNLLSVYLDAVFFPCLRELDFWQEGWRLEHENPNDPSSPLVFKGVVFNEMKGAFAQNESLYAQHLQNKLFPDHTYSVVSGGEPLTIPDLTLEQLKQFHATHYHPSNARFFTYGDLPLESHLKQIHEEALCKFDWIEPNTAVPSQRRWDRPREYHITCGSDPLSPEPSKQNTLCVSYLLGDITDSFEAFTLSLLSSLMVNGPNSPLYKALIEPKIGTDFSSVVGYDGSTKEASFSIGLQGIAEEDMETVKHIIFQTIDEIIATGFEEQRIEALLHKIEVQMKHQSTSFGLSLAFHIAPCWNHDGDPVQLLKISDNVAKFKQCLKNNPRYLQEKVQQYFKDNTHRLTLSMNPDEAYVEKQAKAEQEKLQQKMQSLSDSDRKEIYNKGLQLLSIQSMPQDTSCLPALKVSDIEPTLAPTPLEMGRAGTYVPVQLCPQPTNGMVYFHAMCSLQSLPDDLKVYVPLFCNVITKLGCGSLDYRQQSQQMELKTGGMEVSPQVITDSANLDVYEQGILLISSCLERNMPDMFHLWSEIFNRAHFEDVERLRVLVTMAAQELSNGISYSGHRYAMTRAGHTLTAAGKLHETFGGIDQVRFMKSLAEMSDLNAVLRKLPQIQKYIFNKDNMRCAINATPQNISDASSEVEKFLGRISTDKTDRRQGQANIVEQASFKPAQMKTYFELPFPVSYVGESIRTVPFAHEDYASLCVLSRMMTAKFLHGEIREKGGAYGGGATMGRGGLFSFYSYRDPSSAQTLSAFQGAVEWAKAGKFSQQDIDEAKLSVFSVVDAPVAPSDKGMDQFINGVTDDLKQKHREQLFTVTKQSLTDVASRYLGIGQKTRGVAILGPKNEIIEKDPSWVLR
ncbi:presequence protease, mitochondrial-like [Arapaima gigas]